MYLPFLVTVIGLALLVLMMGAFAVHNLVRVQSLQKKLIEKEETIKRQQREHFDEMLERSKQESKKIIKEAREMCKWNDYAIIFYQYRWRELLRISEKAKRVTKESHKKRDLESTIIFYDNATKGLNHEEFKLITESLNEELDTIDK